MADKIEKNLIKQKIEAEKHLEDVDKVMDAIEKLASFYFSKKLFEEALDYYMEFLEYCGKRQKKSKRGKSARSEEALEQTNNRLLAHRKISECYCELDDFDKALSHQQKCQEIVNSLNDDLERLRVANALGRIYYLKAKNSKEKTKSIMKSHIPQEAKELLNKAKQYFQDSKRLHNKCFENGVNEDECLRMEAILLLNTGLVNEELGERKKAFKFGFNKAKELCLRQNLPESIYNSIIMSIADFYDKMKEHQEALNTLDESLEKIKNDYLRNEILLVKASILLKTGKLLEAKDILIDLYSDREFCEIKHKTLSTYLKIAMKIITIEDNLCHLDDDNALLDSYEMLGDLYSYVGDLDSAYKAYGEFWNFAIKVNNNKKISESLVSIYETLIENENYAEALPFVKRELKTFKSHEDFLKTLLGLVLTLAHTEAPHEEIKMYFDQIIKHAKNSGNFKLQTRAIDELIEISEIFNINYFNNIEEIKKNNEKDRLKLALEENDEEVPGEHFEQHIQNVLRDVNLDIFKSNETESSPAKKSKKSHSSQNHGEPVIHSACRKGNLKNLKQILKDKKVDVNKIDEITRITPLQVAAGQGNMEICRLLLKNHADINKYEEGTLAPILSAAKSGVLSLTRYLYNKGADIQILSADGENIVDILQKKKGLIRIPYFNKFIVELKEKIIVPENPENCIENDFELYLDEVKDPEDQEA